MVVENLFLVISGAVLVYLGYRSSIRFRRPEKILISILIVLGGLFLILKGLGA